MAGRASYFSVRDTKSAIGLTQGRLDARDPSNRTMGVSGVGVLRSLACGVAPT